MNRALEARQDPAIESRIIDLAHKDVVADPKAVIQKIYDKFGLQFSAAHKTRIDQFLNETPAAKRIGKHKHSPEQYGIDINEIHERMRAYYDRFGHLLGRPTGV